MEINIKLNIDEITVAKLAENTQSNEDSFIKDFCATVLEEISSETTKITEEVNGINLANPFSFPQHNL